MWCIPDMPGCRGSSLCLQGKLQGRRGKRIWGDMGRHGDTDGEREGRKQLPNVASLPSQLSKAVGTAGQGCRNGATKAKGQGARNHGNSVLSVCQEKILNLYK